MGASQARDGSTAATLPARPPPHCQTLSLLHVVVLQFASSAVAVARPLPRLLVLTTLPAVYIPCTQFISYPPN
jgi:hypothetical protein